MDKAFALDCIAINPSSYQAIRSQIRPLPRECANKHLGVVPYLLGDERVHIVTLCKKDPLTFVKANPRFLFQLRLSTDFSLEDKEGIRKTLVESLRALVEESQPQASDPTLSLFITEILNIKHPDLQDYFLQSLTQLDIEKTRSIFEEIQSKIKGESANSQMKIIQPRFAILSSTAEESVKTALSEHIQAKNKFFKDSKKLQPFLLLLKDLYLQNRPELYRILSTAFAKDQTNSENEILEKRLSYLSALLTINPQRFAGLTDDQIQNNHDLIRLLLQDLTDARIKPEGCSEEALATHFISLRNPGALLTYIARHKNDPKMVEAIAIMLKSTIQDKFFNERHENNFHKNNLTQEQKNIWETAISKENASALFKSNQPKAAAFDIRNFLYTKICLDNHDSGKLVAIKPYLQAIIIEPTSPLPTVEEDSLAAKVLALLSSQNLIESLENLKRAIQENEEYKSLEFLNDIGAALRALKPYELGSLALVDSEDAEDLFLCGTEISGSCQRVDGNPSLNKCLMGYVLDGKVRLLAVKNTAGSIVARAIVKLLLDKDDKPVIFIERIYGDERLKDALYSLAKKKALLMGVDLFDAGGQQPLHSLGNPAPYEYEDGGDGVTNGKYTISGEKISIID